MITDSCALSDSSERGLGCTDAGAWEASGGIDIRDASGAEVCGMRLASGSHGADGIIRSQFPMSVQPVRKGGGGSHAFHRRLLLLIAWSRFGAPPAVGRRPRLVRRRASSVGGLGVLVGAPLPLLGRSHAVRPGRARQGPLMRWSIGPRRRWGAGAGFLVLCVYAGHAGGHLLPRRRAICFSVVGVGRVPVRGGHDK